MVNKELLHSLFVYNDGKLYWKVNRGRKKAGDIAGNINSRGYMVVGINKKVYSLHRIIFMMHHDYLPVEVDHKDTDKLNNKIENLRAATHGQNQQNKPLQANNTSGIKGVVWHKTDKKWRVQIRVQGKLKHFGAYNDIDYARFVADAMRHKYHGQFYRGEK
jgi:hypothetical protein